MALTQSQSFEDIRKSYGGSDPTYPSSLRSYYVKHNSLSKSRDIGAVESLVTDISGSIGSQAGTNTLFFKFELLSPADVRIQIRSSGSSTDRFLTFGLLDASRKSIQLDAQGFGFANDVHNTDGDESIQKLPAGIYYISLTSSQWQSIPYVIRISVIKFILLAGTVTGSFLPSARLPLLKIDGFAAGTAQSAGTLRSPVLIKKLNGAAGGGSQSALTLVIPSGAAGGSMLPYARLMMNWRLEGVAQGNNSSAATLTSEAPYGGGY